MRLFFGIELSTKIKSELFKIIRTLHDEAWSQQVRWVEPENFHITLRFIGSCDAEKISALIDTTTLAVKIIKPFSISLNKICLFPSPMHPVVIAITTTPSAELFKLVETVETSVRNLNFPAENRSYLAHLSIARLPKRTLNIDAHFFPKINQQILIDHITLFSSEKMNNRQVYNPINHIILK